MTYDEYLALDEKTRMRMAVSQALAANVDREMLLVDAPSPDGAEGADPVVDPDRLLVLHGAKGGIRRPAKAYKSSAGAKTAKSSAGSVLSSPKSRKGPAGGTKAPHRRSGS